MRVRSADGVIHEFPDGTDMAVVDRVMKEYATGQSAAPQAAAPKAAPVTAPEPRPSVPFLSQGTARGLADASMIVPDMQVGLVNNVLRGINTMFGTDLPAATMPSDKLAEYGTKFADLVGRDVVEPKTFAEKTKYNVGRFGAQAAVSVPALVKAAEARAAEIAAGSARQFGDKLLKPYMGEDVSRTLIGDAFATAGAGTGAAAADTVYPDSPVAQVLGGLAGGVGGMTIPQVGARALAPIARAAGRPFGLNLDKSVPTDPVTGNPVTRKFSDTVAGVLQDRAAYPDSAERMLANKKELLALDPNAPMPSPAALSEDHGLRQIETALAMKNPAVTSRNRAFNSAVRDTLDRTVPENADPQALVNRVQSVADSRIEGAQAKAGRAAQREARVADMRQGDAANVTPFAGRNVAASQRLDKAVVDEGYLPARTKKNRQFDTAPGRTEQLPADEVTAAAQEVRARNNALRPDNQLPEEFIRRIEALAPDIQQETVVSPIADKFGRPITRMTETNLGGEGTALGGDLADTRKYISTAIEKARAAGNFDMADSLVRLRSAVNKTIEAAPGYAEANANYRENFAPTYRPGPGDEAAKFTRQIDRDSTRSTTPPSETAGRFIQPQAPEKQAALRRMVDAAASPEDGRAAAREYLMSDLEASGVVDRNTGVLRPDKLRAWQAKWGDLDTVAPGLNDEVAQLTGRAVKGERVAGVAAERTKETERGVRRTQEEINKGALDRVLNADPDKAVAAIMGDKNRVNKSMDELISAIGNDQEAKNGLKAAVGRYLADRTTTNAVEKLRPGDRRAPVSQNALNEILDDPNTAKALSKVFSPEEMNTLRAGQKALNLTNIERLRASSGSDTAEKMGIVEQFLRTPLGKGTEAALRIKYGILKAGGMTATARRLLSGVTTGVDPDEVARLLDQAIQDPELMGLLLGRKLPIASPAWNRRMQRYLAIFEGMRTKGPDENQN